MKFPNTEGFAKFFSITLLKVDILGDFPVSPNDGDSRSMAEDVAAWENEQKIDKTSEIFFWEIFDVYLIQIWPLFFLYRVKP